MGRKITKPFTDDLAEEICERLIEGESLRSICRDDHMPSAATVCRWQVERSEFAEQYARARAAQADTLADELLDIADDDAEDVNRSRLRVDARKWIASKLKPKSYGDKMDVNHGGNVNVTLESDAKDL